MLFNAMLFSTDSSTQNDINLKKKLKQQQQQQQREEQNALQRVEEEQQRQKQQNQIRQLTETTKISNQQPEYSQQQETVISNNTNHKQQTNSFINNDNRNKTIDYAKLHSTRSASVVTTKTTATTTTITTTTPITATIAETTFDSDFCGLRIHKSPSFLSGLDLLALDSDIGNIKREINTIATTTIAKSYNCHNLKVHFTNSSSPIKLDNKTVAVTTRTEIGAAQGPTTVNLFNKMPAVQPSSSLTTTTTIATTTATIAVTDITITTTTSFLNSYNKNSSAISPLSSRNSSGGSGGQMASTNNTAICSNNDGNSSGSNSFTVATSSIVSTLAQHFNAATSATALLNTASTTFGVATNKSPVSAAAAIKNILNATKNVGNSNSNSNNSSSGSNSGNATISHTASAQGQMLVINNAAAKSEATAANAGVAVSSSSSTTSSSIIMNHNNNIIESKCSSNSNNNNRNNPSDSSSVINQNMLCSDTIEIENNQRLILTNQTINQYQNGNDIIDNCHVITAAAATVVSTMTATTIIYNNNNNNSYISLNTMNDDGKNMKTITTNLTSQTLQQITGSPGRARDHNIFHSPTSASVSVQLSLLRGFCLLAFHII